MWNRRKWSPTRNCQCLMTSSFYNMSDLQKLAPCLPWAVHTPAPHLEKPNDRRLTGVWVVTGPTRVIMPAGQVSRWAATRSRAAASRPHSPLEQWSASLPACKYDTNISSWKHGSSIANLIGIKPPPSFFQKKKKNQIMSFLCLKISFNGSLLLLG